MVSKVVEMKANYITEPMRKYGTWTDNLMKTMPKHSRPYGIKRPENWILVTCAASIIVIMVVVSQLIL